MDPRVEQIINAAHTIETILQGRKPEIGIVLGSGLGSLAEAIEDPVIIPYHLIAGFPVSTATGHKGNYIVGNLGGKTVIAMQGRIHYYEGYGMDSVVLPIRVMIDLGIRALLVSNAAGGVSFSLHLGDLMIIKDHINLLPNPLIGPNIDKFGPRFPDMTTGIPWWLGGVVAVLMAGTSFPAAGVVGLLGGAIWKFALGQVMNGIWLLLAAGGLSLAMPFLAGVVHRWSDRHGHGPMAPDTGRGDEALPFALTLMGVVGGTLAFGFIGLFLGPVVLSLGRDLLQELTKPRGEPEGALPEPAATERTES